MGMKWRVIFVAVFVGCVWISVSDDSSVEYKTEPASIGSVISTITSVGTLRHFEEAEIHSAIQGSVVEVLKEQSEPVAAGEVIIRLDATVLKSRYENTRTELETKKADFKYESELYAKQLTSTNDYNKAKIAMEQANAEFSEAKKRFQSSEIKSPIDGTVIFRAVEVGRSVDSKGGVLMKVAGSSDKMRLFIRISEADIGRVSQKQEVLFTVSAFKDKSFSGKVLSVPESPIEGTGAVIYEVSAFVENPNYMLKSGMTADVTVKIGQVDGVVRIPTDALRFIPPDGSAHASTSSEVWIKTRSGAIKRLPVTVGESNEIFTEVVKGEISEGDNVIVGIVPGTGGEGSRRGMSLPQPKRF